MNKITNKLRGGYYTPKQITDFITRWTIDKPGNVLEPSCGDGNFIESVVQRFESLKCDVKGQLTAVELIKEEIDKAKKRFKDSLSPRNFINTDFFHYLKKHHYEKPTFSKPFDFIVGNPPFIRYQDFPEEHREIAFEMMNDLGLPHNRLTNIWVPFLILCSNLLSSHGRMGLVIPAELFQVNYSSSARKFLSEYFDRVSIVTFKKLVFKSIQQEVVILLCERKTRQEKGIRVVELENLEDLETLSIDSFNDIPVKELDHSQEKWIKYFLDQDEIEFLRKIKNSKNYEKLEEYASVDVGIVTGRNEFFMMNHSHVKKWGVGKSIIPVIGKSDQLKGITLSEQRYKVLSESDKKVFMFYPSIPPNKNEKKYILYGEENGFNLGYKCRIRKNWFVVPSISIPDAFALRQVNHYPKIVLNDTGASSTDTIHRLNFHVNESKPKKVACFINSLTFAFSEITGRSYGGGVMTFEPTEVEELPFVFSEKVNPYEIDELIQNNEVEKALDLNDKILFLDTGKFSQSEVLKLRNIWKKLRDRRLYRKKR